MKDKIDLRDIMDIDTSSRIIGHIDNSHNHNLLDDYATSLITLMIVMSHLQSNREGSS